MEDIICSLTGKIFNMPVTMRDGYTYEKQAIEKWRLKNKYSPSKSKVWIPNKFDIDTEMVNRVKNYLNSNPSMKKDQYQLSAAHIDNINEINKIIEADNYNELLNYTDFDFIMWSNNNLFTRILKLGSFDVLKHIFEHCNNNNITPDIVKQIITNSTSDIVKYLIDKNINISDYDILRQRIPDIFFHLIDQQNNASLVKYVIYNCSDDIIKYLINKKSYLDPRDSNNEAAIHHILRNKKNNELIIQIIDVGIDLELPGKHNMQPIHYAIKYSTIEIVKYLIKQGVTLECCDDFGRLPIHYAAQYGTLELIDCLNGVNFNCRDKNGLKPIHHALINGNNKIIEKLLNFDIYDDTMEFMISFCKEKIRCHETLYFYIIILSEKYKKFCVHFLPLIPNIPLETVQNFIDQETDLNRETNDGWRPIHIAINCRRFDIAKYLINRGIDLECKINKNKKPIDIALEMCDKKFIKYMINDLHVDVSHIKVININCGKCPPNSHFECKSHKLETSSSNSNIMELIWIKNGSPGKINECTII